jgi:hypothetical protein
MDIASFITDYWKYITLVMVIASLVVNFTPNKVDNKYFNFVLKIVNAIAANFNVKGVLNK